MGQRKSSRPTTTNARSPLPNYQSKPPSKRQESYIAEVSRDSGLTDRDLEFLDNRMELVIRRYFDVFLKDVMPKLIEAAVAAHDGSDKAHGGTIDKMRQLGWKVTGLIASGGLIGGAGLTKLAEAIGFG